jgi:hypothetical protein
LARFKLSAAARIPSLNSRHKAPDSALETRDALLQRGLVMSVHGLFPEMLDDFAAYVSKLDASSAKPNEKERQRISTMTSVHDTDATPPAQFYRLLGGLCRGRPELFKATIRGLYWSVTREVRRRHVVLVARLLGFAAILGTAYLAPGAKRRRDRGVQ